MTRRRPFVQSRADRLGDDPGGGDRGEEKNIARSKDKEEGVKGEVVIETRVVEHVERYG